MGYQAANEEMRSNYLDLHVKTLLDARNPIFHGITLQGYCECDMMSALGTMGIPLQSPL
jgi:hypothetical protein